MCPAALDTRTSDPEAEGLRLAVACQRRGGRALDFGSSGIAIPPLIVVEALLLTAEVTTDSGEPPEEERLAHHVQLATEGVDQLHELISGAGGKPFVVGFGGEGVIEKLIEACARQLLREEDATAVRAVARSLGAEVSMDVATEFDIIVSVDAHNLLDDVGLTSHVDTIAGYTQLPSVFLTGDDLDLKALEDTYSLVTGDELTDECIHMAGAQRHFVGLSRHGIVVEAATIDIATGAKLEDERSGTHQRPRRTVGVQPTLKAEGGVRIHSQTACGLTHGGSVEVR